MTDRGPPLPERLFLRQDESDDAGFYAQPRFTTHIDDATIAALTDYYAATLRPADRVLDLMSSWISHLPPGIEFRSVTALGMNAEELAANSRADRWVLQDLNVTPALPFDDAAFDAVLIAVSVQYLTRPLEVFAEIGRVLAPGGRCVVAMSHRLFPTKAIYAFHVLPAAERCRLVATYLSSSGAFIDIEMLDRSPPAADPLWIVTALRQ